MAFPVEFQYENEDDFIQRFLIPLLQRLGFAIVFNYHGKSEFGKDLIFGEIDRFGHVRYHGLQAKYEASISLNDVADLINDCKQAFANPFTHPQTGLVECISSFYAVNGGSLGPEAVKHYFNSLRPSYSGNVQLLQGKDLVTLDRWASVNRDASIGEQIRGLILELRYNRWMADIIRNTLTTTNKRPVERFRLGAASAYLSSPNLHAVLNTTDVDKYWHFTSSSNRMLDMTTNTMAINQSNTAQVTADILNTLLPHIETSARTIEEALTLAVRTLGPLAGM